MPEIHLPGDVSNSDATPNDEGLNVNLAQQNRERTVDNRRTYVFNLHKGVSGLKCKWRMEKESCDMFGPEHKSPRRNRVDMSNARFVRRGLNIHPNRLRVSWSSHALCSIGSQTLRMTRATNFKC